MDLPELLTLEDLLGFIGKKSAKKLAEAIRTRNSWVIKELKTIEKKSSDYYDDLYETEGPQALSHLAWLQVGLGNYCLALGSKGLSQILFYKAWTNFSSPLARGHDEMAHMLAKEFPELLNIKDVSNYYKKHPTTAKYYGIDALFRV